MLSTSQRAPGYRFQYHVPPTPPPASNPCTRQPSPRSLCSAYRPANPAPTTTTSSSRTSREGIGVTVVSASGELRVERLEQRPHRDGLRQVRARAEVDESLGLTPGRVRAQDHDGDVAR